MNFDYICILCRYKAGSALIIRRMAGKWFKAYPFVFIDIYYGAVYKAMKATADEAVSVCCQ
jgi:hypothetical protein